MKKSSFVSLVILIILLSGCNNNKEVEKQSKDDFNPDMAYTPLEIGAIKPGGWLLDWARAASDGITGHLDERATTYEKGWSGESFEALGAGEEGTGWPLEQSAYWLDGLIRLAYILDDSILINKVKARLDPIVDGVLNGGSSFIYWRSEEQLKNTFDNWAHSHIGRALTAYYSATKDQRILEALVKVYTNYTFPEYIPSDFFGVNGVVNIDPIMETYIFSKDTGVLAKALSLTEMPDFKKMVRRWNQDSLDVGHGVIFYENIRVPAILSALSHDTSQLTATLNALEWAEKDNLLPVGLLSSEEYLAGIGSARNIETCNVAAGPNMLNWLLRITGERKWADQIEQVFFNAGPVPVSRDFQTMSYYQSPNRIGPGFPLDNPSNPGEDAYLYTEIGHSVLCCIGNCNRIIPNFVMNMWMKTEDDGLVAVLYGPSVLNTEIRGKSIEIKSKTNYPFEDNIQLTIETIKKNKFTLGLRIPVWCENPGIKINGKETEAIINEKGFVLIHRIWRSGDNIDLSLPMKVRVIQGRENKYADINYYKKNSGARRLARSDQDINNPFVSVFYGPLLMALPIPDKGPNEVLKETPFNYALNIPVGRAAEVVELRKNKLTSPWQWQLDNPPLEIMVPAIQFNWCPTELQALPPEPVYGGKDTSISLVPYNITKFRVSMFPVSASSWSEN